MSILAPYLLNVKVELRPQSRITNGPFSKKLTPATTSRRPDANGTNSVRRFPTVRASSSNESPGNPQHGVDVKKDEGTRYQWLWNDYTGLGSSLDSTDPDLDMDTVQSICPSPSEVWGCYDNLTPKSSSSSANSNGVGDTSLEETSDSSALTTEKEFYNYARNLPRPQFSGIDLMDAGNHYYTEMEEVYVLLFGVGEGSTEGIYSLRSYCLESGLHKETIICFESYEDAVRFSGLLEATMPHLSTVHTIKASELVQFCTDSGYACRLELEGSTLTPPEFNVGVTDWERSLRLRQGHYEVLETEPEMGESVSPMKQDTMQETKTDATSETRISDSINMQIDDVREMLERLLPDD